MDTDYVRIVTMLLLLLGVSTVGAVNLIGEVVLHLESNEGHSMVSRLRSVCAGDSRKRLSRRQEWKRGYFLLDGHSERVF